MNDGKTTLKTAGAPSAHRFRAGAAPVGGQAERRDAGFTLMEVLIALGILTVLLAVVFVNVIQVWKNLQQMELDATAKELYEAAQNHLALAESQGLLEEGNGISLGANENGSADARQDDVYYFVYAPGVVASSPNNPDNKSSALNLMLPFGSIDETVRTGGSYVIRYQPSTSTVIDVFFAKPGDNGVSFSAADEQTLVNSYRGDENKDARKDYNHEGKIIGYYGGDDLGESAVKLAAPTLQVINGDTLTVKATSPTSNNAALTKYNNAYGKTDKLMLCVMVEGKSSNAAMWFEKEIAANATSANEFSVVLDDVTTQDGRFYQVAQNRPAKYVKAGANPFIPGEDLSIYAWVTSTGRAIVAKSAATTTNSLFASSVALTSGSDDQSAGQAQAPASGTSAFLETAGVTAATASKDYTANIVSFRHLANLSGEVSHFNYKVNKDASGKVLGLDPINTEYSSVTAKQTTDLTWGDFKGSATTHDGVRIWKDGAVSSKQGTFMPVAANYVLNYSGEGHAVNGLVANADGPAGMFAALNVSGSSVDDLELVDFSVTSTAGDAGALAGHVGAGVTVTNVLARESLTNALDTWQIAGATTAGGLVGRLSGGTVNQSAAAVYVRATGASGAAGGLVGMAQESAAISNSYAGGHTIGGTYLSTQTLPGRINVLADAGPAGGLVGSFAGAAATNCYSTCSVRGAAGSGGLLGAANGGSVSNSYCVGAVSGGGKGNFVGLLSGTSLSNCRCLETVNQHLATGADGGVSTFDVSTESYQTLVVGAGSAIPYDRSLVQSYGATLTQSYQERFPFMTIAELAGTSTFAGTFKTHLTTHYGDWPAVETPVPNSK